MTEQSYDVMQQSGRAPVKMWTKGVAVEDGAKAQLAKTAAMPFIYKWIAVMPDVHQGIGSTVGSVIPTLGAVIPAAVGVDIGCGMIAARTSLVASDLRWEYPAAMFALPMPPADLPLIGLLDALV